MAEFKMICKSFNSKLTKFAVRFRYDKNSPEKFTQQFRSLSHCVRFFPPPSKFWNQCSSNCLHQSNCFTVRHKNLSHQCSSDVIQIPKCLGKCPSDLISPRNCVTLIQRSSNDLLFRQFDSRRFESPNLLLADKHTLGYLRGLPKSFFGRRKNDGNKPKRRIPKLILIQNPFTWLMIKIDFSVLRNLWDPEFSENEFKYGTKQAISRVTNVVSEGQFAELNGLLTKAARLSLMRELDRNWSEKQRVLLALKNEDIQISSPRKVYFIRIADKKYCDVDMAFLALKWAPINSIEALIFTEIFARFHREYTPHSIPQWTIAYFKVTRFEVLRKKSKLT